MFLLLWLLSLVRTAATIDAAAANPARTTTTILPTSTTASKNGICKAVHYVTRTVLKCAETTRYIHKL